MGSTFTQDARVYLCGACPDAATPADTKEKQPLLVRRKAPNAAKEESDAVPEATSAAVEKKQSLSEPDGAQAQAQVPAGDDGSKSAPAQHPSSEAAAAATAATPPAAAAGDGAKDADAKPRSKSLADGMDYDADGDPVELTKSKAAEMRQANIALGALTVGNHSSLSDSEDEGDAGKEMILF
eukprot:TRINITY_DN20660_c0_g1_i1.p1 TRINITY_DN20660_c0_g1~~TRINITY_DN20660_c0_g1_i1.p1  ORF type:complete len:182 (-),score=66.42 TRINITY_DN20660_c0_g1_i1:230-775(-)